MKNPKSRELYDYWQRLRGRRPAPDRAEIEPSDIRGILGDTFILELTGLDGTRFRLAGSRVCALFGRELRGRDFMSFWRDRDRGAIDALLQSIAEEAAAAVIGFSAHAGREYALSGELLLLPLRQPGEAFHRIIGVLAPSETPFWIGTQPVAALEMLSLRLLWPNRRSSALDRHRGPTMRMSAPESRQVKHLVVYEGGRS